MGVIVRKTRGLSIPEAITKKAGIRPGDVIEFTAGRGTIVIHATTPPSADDEYTPEQRKILDAQLAEGLAEIKAGRTAGPFNTADEMIAHMKGELKKRAAAKRVKRSR